MDERLQAVEAELRRIAGELAGVQARVASLEAGVRTAGALAPTSHIEGPVVTASALRGARPQAVVPALGRALIGLGGAYLLRAVTETGVLAPALGVGAGLVYAAAWLAATARSARRATPIDAGFQGAVAVLVAFPLIVEATLRFAIVPPGLAALALAALSAFFLGVAWRSDLHGLAWLTVVAALGTGLVLMARTGIVLPYASLFIAIGIATLWLGYDREWVLLRWPAALVADVVVAGLLLRVSTDPPLDPAGHVQAVQALLMAAYLGSIALRTLVRGRQVIPFEVVQTVAVLVVGLGGGLSIGRGSAAGMAMGGVVLLLAAGAYGVAFAFLERRHDRGINFYFYSSLALVCTLAGTGVLLPHGPRALVWSALAVAAAFAAGRVGRTALAFHGAAYLAGAALAAQLLPHAFARLFGAPMAGVALWPEVVVLAAAAVICTLPPAVEAGLPRRLGRLHQFAAAFVVLSGGTGWTVLLAVAAVQAAGFAPVPDGMSATMRTVALAGGAVVAAWLAQQPRLSTFGIFVYPMLAVVGVKLLVEDLRVSEPATLFVALAAFGAALVVAPRFTRDRLGRRSV
ncbi:MAG: hypothetical protein Q8L86_07135 [Vicinamibacterales bacterium]|nr:hypothetical protein [Vicinamibacterales bacterium]